MLCPAISYIICVGSKVAERIARWGRFEVEFGARRGDRVAYGGGLENRFRLFWRTWVRIPPPPPIRK
jgi:hypothetical protein